MEEHNWEKLKELIQSIKPKEFEKLVATLLTSFLQVPFVVARSGDQPSGDARSKTNEISIQTKRYTTTRIDPTSIEGDIRQVIRTLLDLQVYVLAVSRDLASQPRHRFDDIEKETGVDIVTLELTDERSELGVLCVTFWEDICDFFESSSITQQFMNWIENERENTETIKKIEDVRSKLEDGIQTQKHVQEDIEEYLLGDLSTLTGTKGFNPINLSEAIERKCLESEITDWWETTAGAVCCLEGKEGHGKSWLAAKCMNTIRESENVVTFWLDSKDWSGCKSIFDLLYACFNSIYPSYEPGKITKLQNKPAKIWRKTLIVLDGVNEWNAIEAAQRILSEYFRHSNELTDRVRFLLTIRSLDNYPSFESYLPEDCHKISVDSFNDAELHKALTRKGLQLDDLPDSLKKDVARIPRYLQRCVELRDELGSFGVVTTELVLLADLSEKIKHSDPQMKEKLGWFRLEDPKNFFLHLAKQIKWNKIDDAPEKLGRSLKECFSDYSKIRLDLAEQGIVRNAEEFDVKLSDDHVLLCWALYLSSLFDSVEFTKIEDLLERFQQELEPILQEDVRTEALFAALQLSAIFPNTNLSQDQLSQKRAALMLAWFNSHNAQFRNERISFWVEEDPDAYAQIVEFEFKHHNAPKYEEMLIEPLAKTWLDEKGQIDRLTSRLKKWLLPTHSVNSPENRKYVNFKGVQVPRKDYDPQVQLSAAALSILSQRPEPEFLETLARCHEILERYENIDRRNIGILMRWGYTEKVLEDLYSLVEQSPSDTQLLKGVCRLVDYFRIGLPPNLERALSKEDLEKRAFIEQYDPILNRFIDSIRNEERILTEDSPETNANRGYYGLDYLAVRKDLPALCHEDQNEIKQILHHISFSPETGLNRDLIPWIAKYTPESYRELSCDLKINALNPEYPPSALRVTQELIFSSEDCKKIAEAILKMKECLVQEDDSSHQRVRLLTEILLFSASEEQSIDWFEFLASYEPLRIPIAYKPLAALLKELLPKSVVKFAQQKLEDLRSSVSDNPPLSNDEEQEFLEEELWCMLYAYGVQVDENSVQYALEELKMREPDSTGTFPMLRLALSDSKQFLDEMLVNEKIKEHLSSKNGRQFRVLPYDNGKDVPSYDALMSSLPPEAVGSFLCSSDRRDDLARWGKELIRWLCSVLQGNEGNFDYNSEVRFLVDTKVLQTWAEQNTTEFSQLADEYLTELSQSLRHGQALSHFTDAIRCLLLRFQPDKAMEYYRRWKTESFKTVISTQYGTETFLAQLWQVEECKLPEHHNFRRELLKEGLNDEDIMFMTLAALAGKGEEELWNLVTEKYLASPYAKERNLGVSILPWFGNDKAIGELERLKSDDTSLWVREHATWAYEVAQQERSCHEVYREALQSRNPARISAVFEQMKPALSPIARWWRREIEKEVFGEELRDIDPKIAALHYRFWHRWGKSQKTKRNIEIFGRELKDYCRGEKLPAVSTPRLAPWWKPSSD